MATLDTLKRYLLKDIQASAELSAATTRPISDAEYISEFEKSFRQGAGRAIYQDFIAPNLSQLLKPLIAARPHTGISVLEIGPGPESVFGLLPEEQRGRICKYTAFEPKALFASRMEAWIGSGADSSRNNDRDVKSRPLPGLVASPKIHRLSFRANNKNAEGVLAEHSSDAYTGKYDLVIFCHSMYGMKPKRPFIERALGMLVDDQPLGGLVVVFHRHGLHFDGLVCHQMSSFPTGTVSVKDDEETLDSFSRFVAGCSLMVPVNPLPFLESQRAICRSLGRLEGDSLIFRAPEVMVTFGRHAMTLSELLSRVPLATTPRALKNRQARLHMPAAVIRPTEIAHIQDCIRWANLHRVGLSVIGGSHGDHCVVPNVVAIDMSAFDQVYLSSTDNCRQIVAEAGAKSGDIIRKAMDAGLTVPLGSRPSVGAGLWLQGGIGHLARLHGLACDAIVGAVLVGADSGQIWHIGTVPAQHLPTAAIRPEKETDILWALKGAGTNFGIVVSVVFKTFTATEYLVRNWNLPLDGHLEARHKVKEFDESIASKLPRDFSADAYLYWDATQLHLGVTMYQVLCPGFNTSSALHESTPFPTDKVLGPPSKTEVVDGIGLFETEMYMSGMHGGHGGGKTYSFKRCVFLKDIGSAGTVQALVHALETRPSELCYLHLLHGGGAIRDAAPDATAFGCRGWDFACVVTGVWLRNQADGSAQTMDEDMAYRIQEWVYRVVNDLLSLSPSSGSQSISAVYPADLGPDPRDASLAIGAFGKGPNRPRLARLKNTLDPRNVMAYACPLPRTPANPKLVILVTGEHGAGKDYCARVWASAFSAIPRPGSNNQAIRAHCASISDATKREYATTMGADLDRLLNDRAYKECHRPALTAFFQNQVRQRPRLPEEHFLNVVYRAADDNVDVLLITGMRDEAPVAMFSHLVPDSKVIEVCVHRKIFGDEKVSVKQTRNEWMSPEIKAHRTYMPDLMFLNDMNNPGEQPVKLFAEHHLIPFLHSDFYRLQSLVRLVPDFPRPGIDFRHVLGITQLPGGLELVTGLLLRTLNQSLTRHGTSEQGQTQSCNVEAIVACETGGFLFASALAVQMHKRLVLIRKSGKKLPPPTYSVGKGKSHISMDEQLETSMTGVSLVGNGEEVVEMERDAISVGDNCQSSFLVVDDVLATGKTLCAILRLLAKAGVKKERINVVVVAEFPVHRGRRLLREQGFGGVKVQSLLVFNGL